MFEKLLGSTLGVAADIATVAIAPVVVAADLTRAVTKPVADAATEVVAVVSEGVRDLTKR